MFEISVGAHARAFEAEVNLFITRPLSLISDLVDRVASYREAHLESDILVI